MGIEDSLKNAEYLNLDAPNTKTKVSLYLYSNDIDIKLISTSLGCEPTESHRRGDIIEYQRIGRDIRRRPPATVGLWCLAAPDSLSFTDKLTYLLDKTTSNYQTWDSLALSYDMQLRCSVFLHSWHDGFDIPASVIADIGKRHWQFGISMYSAEGNEIIEAFLKKKPVS